MAGAEDTGTWSPGHLGYKEIGLGGMGDKLAAAGIGDDWAVRIVYHTHPFKPCHNFCGFNSSAAGPSAGDQATATKLTGSYHVVRQSTGFTLESGYRDLYYGKTAFEK